MKAAAVLLTAFIHHLVESHSADYVSDQDYYNDPEYDQYEEGRESVGREKVLRRNPKFISPSKSITVNMGGVIKLPCEVDRLEGFMILWKKGEEVLALGDRILNHKDTRIKVESRSNGNTLTVSLAELGDAGNYACQVNAVNSKSLKHQVEIRVAPVVRVADPLLTVEAGQPAQLICEIVEGNPPPALHWTRQGEKLEEGRQESVQDGRLILRLPSVDRQHAGQYTCLGDNGWGILANNTMTLKVLHAPVIEATGSDYVQARAGVEVEVTCLVHATPPPHVDWYRNGLLLDPQDIVTSIRGRSYTLIATPIGGRHTFGQYECRASNSYGEVRRTIEVGGLADPVIFSTGTAEAEPNSHTLAWSVRSLVPVTEFRLEYQEATETNWRSVSTTPEPAADSSLPAEVYRGRLRLERLTPGTVYRVRASALNQYGWSPTAAESYEFVTAGPKTARPLRFEPSIDTKLSSAAARQNHLVAVILLVVARLLVFNL